MKSTDGSIDADAGDAATLNPFTGLNAGAVLDPTGVEDIITLESSDSMTHLLPGSTRRTRRSFV
jgi:hypothetical protein